MRAVIAKATIRRTTKAAMMVSPLAAIAFLSLSFADEPQDTPLRLALRQPPNANAGQAAEGKSAAKPVHRRYAGFKDCLRCHNSGVQGVSVPLPGGGTLNLADDQWVLYREYPIWAQEDKHGQAYTVLLNQRSKRIGKLLGVPEIHRDKRCLTCHTGFPIHEMPVGGNDLVSKDLEKSLDVNLGVSCEGCHGPAGDAKDGDKVVLAGWMGPHQIQPVVPYDKTNPWRFRSPQTKHDKYGFNDVRSPASRARICASCHIGNVAQGKLVTHEMYAAGHPPLPGFEVETFVAQMPNHWRSFAEKSDKVREQFLKNSKDGLYSAAAYKQADLHRTKSMLIGALVSFSEYMNLTAQLTDDTVASPVEKPRWPELAQFECYACHHDLRTPAWRQSRKPPVGTPGRPPLREWTTALVKLAVQVAADAADLEQQLSSVRKAIDVQPFGKQAALKASAAGAAKWSSSVADALQKKSLAPADGVTIRKQIAETAAAEILDYDSARQLVWAFKIVNAELKRTNEVAAIQPILDGFEKDMFLLDLRSGRKAGTKIPGETQARNTVEVDLTSVLPKVADYDPADFQKRFQEIAKLLAK